MRAARRAYGLCGLAVTTVPPRAPTGGLHQPGLPQRGHRLAQGRPAHREPRRELALGRQRAAHRVDAEADRAAELLDAGLERVVAAHRAQHRLAEVLVRGGGHGVSLLRVREQCQWSEFIPIYVRLWTANHRGSSLRSIVTFAAPGGLMADIDNLTDDEKHLAKLGYKQELHRSWSGFSNFAISFSIISILAGCFTTFGQGFNNGGPDRHLVGLADRLGVHPDHRPHHERAGLGLPDLRRHLLVGSPSWAGPRPASSPAGSTSSAWSLSPRPWPTDARPSST